MKVLTEENCPHCKKTFESSHSMDNIEPVINKGEIKEIQSTQNTGNAQSTQIKEPQVEVKTEIKAVSPSDEPFYTCKNGNCGSMHKNPNYSKKPNKKCKNCDSLNGNTKCKNCGNEDSEEFDELDDDELKDLKIPIPEIDEHEGHNHD